MEKEHASKSHCLGIPGVQFKANKDFQTKNKLYGGDSGFLCYRRKWGGQPRGNNQGNREVLKTLLTTYDANVRNMECAEKLLAEDINYGDLATLSHKDLELVGFNNYKQREELLQVFAQLPNQDPSYDDICHLEEASGYNNQIMSRASNHLEAMRSSLAAANYKLQIVPPTDVIVGDKYFASRFLLEALNELTAVTDDIDKQLNQLKTITLNNSDKQPSHVQTNSYQKCVKISLIVMNSISSFALLFAIYYWKFRK